MAKKKAAIMGGAVILVAAVIAIVVVVAVNHKSNNSGSNKESGGLQLSTSVKAVQSICQPTTYRKTCEDALTKAAGNNTDVKSLVKAAFQVTIDNIKEAAKHSSVLLAAAKDPGTTLPLKTCQTLFGYAVQDIEDAIHNIAGYQLTDLDKAVYDLKNWLSAANIYQESCLDEFNNRSMDAALSMKKALNTSMELTSNALAIVNAASTMVSDFKMPSLSRRLMGVDVEGFPSWLSPGRRSLLQMSPLQLQPTITVAKDGSGQYRTIREGLAHMPRNNKDFVVMYVKAGVYFEQGILVDKSLNKLVLIGDGPTKTRISGSLNVARGGGIGTINTATFAVVADNFMARDIGFENTAGPEGHQAVAFRSQSDYSVLLNCHFDGYQDTFYAHAKRHFYRDCTISGTVDFIFGDASAIFQNCVLVVRKPADNQQNMVTAHGSKDATEGTAFIFHNCVVTAEPALVPFIAQNPSYLGRPWKPFARTIYIQSRIDNVIHPDGWMEWQGEPNSKNTCFYAEVDNHGSGSDKSRRVKWPGVKNIDIRAAQKYSLDQYFQQAPWVKSAGVPFIAGLGTQNSPVVPAVPVPVPLPVGGVIAPPRIPVPRVPGRKGKCKKGKDKCGGRRHKGPQNSPAVPAVPVPVPVDRVIVPPETRVPRVPGRKGKCKKGKGKCKGNKKKNTVQ